MADVDINKFRASVVRDGSKPASPGFVVSEGQSPTDPAGSGQNHLPVTIAEAANGLSITDSQVLRGTGTVGQYIRGDGSLADFPESSGGGSSVSYYLNGSVAQGTIGGVAYKELNKVPILGVGTDFTINADGYIASFLTDAGDPNLLEIPGGNWNFETYFSASSGGGSPSFYVELYKVNSGGTATLIASNSTFPELIAFGTNIISYFSTLAVPTTTLALTDRLAIRYYVNHSGRTITLHTEDNHLCQIITTFTTGITALNGLTAQVQNLAVGTSGTDFNIASATATHTFNLPTASATNRGALSSADWTTFNSKQNALTNPVTGTGAQGRVAYWDSTGVIKSDSLFQWNDFSKRLGIGRTPTVSLDVEGAGFFSGTVTALSIIKSGGTSSQYLMADGSVSTLTNPVTGTGATNYLPKFTGSTTIGNSNVINDASGNLGLGINPTNVSNYIRLQISGTTGAIFDLLSGSTRHFTIYNDSSSSIIGTVTNTPLIFQTNDGTKMTLTSGGNLLVGTTTDNGARLQVSGVISVTNSTADNNSGTILNTSTTGYGLRVSGGQSGDNTTRYAFRVSDYQNNPLFSVYGGGAATFSSSVTAAQFLASSSSNAAIITSTGTTGYGLVAVGSAGGARDIFLAGQSGFSNGFTVQYTGTEMRYGFQNGNVLIGTTTDSGARLNVRGSASSYPVSIEADGSGSQLALTRSGAITEIFMGGTSSGATQLYVRSGGSGGVRLDAGSTGWVSASDIRLKDITKPIENAVESLSNLQTIYYSWKDSIDKNLHIGLIAQEVEKVFPELVSESSIDGMKGVNYTELIPVLIAAVKELKQEIDTLKN